MAAAESQAGVHAGTVLRNLWLDVIQAVIVASLGGRWSAAWLAKAVVLFLALFPLYYAGSVAVFAAAALAVTGLIPTTLKPVFLAAVTAPAPGADLLRARSQDHQAALRLGKRGADGPGHRSRRVRVGPKVHRKVHRTEEERRTAVEQ